MTSLTCDCDECFEKARQRLLDENESRKGLRTMMLLGMQRGIIDGDTVVYDKMHGPIHAQSWGDNGNCWDCMMRYCVCEPKPEEQIQVPVTSVIALRQPATEKNRAVRWSRVYRAAHFLAALLFCALFLVTPFFASLAALVTSVAFLAYDFIRIWNKTKAKTGQES